MSGLLCTFYYLCTGSTETEAILHYTYVTKLSLWNEQFDTSIENCHCFCATCAQVVKCAQQPRQFCNVIIIYKKSKNTPKNRAVILQSLHSLQKLCIVCTTFWYVVEINRLANSICVSLNVLVIIKQGETLSLTWNVQVQTG